MAEDCEKNQRRKWSIGREVPLATVAVLLAQTVGAIWWAASITAKVEAVEKTPHLQASLALDAFAQARIACTVACRSVMGECFAP